MPKFAANLSMLYPEHDFLARYAAAARDGFKAVECMFPYEVQPHLIAQALADHGLQQVLINAPAGDWEAGWRGLACVAGGENAFEKSIAQALHYAAVLACPRIHVMAGLVPAGSSAASVRSIYVNNLRCAAKLAAKQAVQLMIEPLNARDMPRYFLSNQAQAHALLDDIAEPNVRVQMDLYHCQISEGDVASKLRQYLPAGRVGHIQIAGVPMRQEPSVGELNYDYLFKIIDELGYTGWVGCEYRPALGMQAGGTSAGLNWLKPYL